MKKYNEISVGVNDRVHMCARKIFYALHVRDIIMTQNSENKDIIRPQLNYIHLSQFYFQEISEL